MKSRILITGCNGMLGRAFIGMMSGKNSLTGLDTGPDRRIVKELDGFIACDVARKEALDAAFEKARPDTVIHSAAWTDVDGCENNEDRAMLVNGTGTENIAGACRKAGALCVYISTDFVFNGLKSVPYVESDQTAPVNIYGRSKLTGEEALRRILERHLIVRTSWLFGPYGRNFVDIILDRAERRQPLRIVMDQFGSPTYTADLARGICTLIDASAGRGGLYGTYHITNGNSCSWFRYAEEILKISGRRDVRPVPITSAELGRPAARPVMSVLDNGKYNSAANEALRPWQAALRAYLKKADKNVRRRV